MFVSWVTNHQVKATTLKDAWVPNWVTYANQHKYGLKRVSSPAPGDVVAFDWGKNGQWDHIGIVERVSGSSVYTIEGNTDDPRGGTDGVLRKTRYKTSSNYTMAYMRVG